MDTAALAKRHFAQILIALGRGANIIVDGHTVGVVLPEVADQAASAAQHMEAHEGRVVLALPQNAENLTHIPRGSFPDGSQVVLLDVRRAKPQHPVDDGVVHRGVVGFS